MRKWFSIAFWLLLILILFLILISFQKTAPQKDTVAPADALTSSFILHPPAFPAPSSAASSFVLHPSAFPVVLPSATSPDPSIHAVLPPSVTAPLEFTNLPPTAVLEAMRLAIHSYNSMFNGNPVGTNPEITRALNGQNPKQAQFIQPEAGMRINQNGELIDPWGTPYFFHQLSANDMEIRSAGPDRVMWTSDDLVAR